MPYDRPPRSPDVIFRKFRFPHLQRRFQNGPNDWPARFRIAQTYIPAPNLALRPFSCQILPFNQLSSSFCLQHARPKCCSHCSHQQGTHCSNHQKHHSNYRSNPSQWATHKNYVHPLRTSERFCYVMENQILLTVQVYYWDRCTFCWRKKSCLEKLQIPFTPSETAYGR